MVKGTSLLVGALVISLVNGARAIALPPPEDTPEEVLRTEIILEARSPLDGEPLTASEYVELQAELAEAAYPPSINSETQQLIFLLRIRKVLNIVLPFQVL
ncbi:MAG: hypothetical protein VKJ64_14040 [Leptolyngbyaceae bacterium]|nr:hypothetical protein [Leptolyngbyaceae bacterium]